MGSNEILDILTLDKIAQMDMNELLRRTPEIFDLNEIDREIALCAAQVQAEKIGFGKPYAEVLKSFRKQAKSAIPMQANTEIDLERDARGLPLPIIDNYLQIIKHDVRFRLLRYNAFNDSAEIDEIMDGELKTRLWTDKDDSRALMNMEKEYFIPANNERKYEHAMRVYMDDNSYNPVTDMLNSLKWDGIPRMEGFFTRWMGCEDNDYSRECSRLVFAGGVHRAYRPGCKFDDVVVLIGTKQGEGKSTLVQWMAMEDRFFAEVTEIDGQRGREAVQGAWICEFSELLALTKSKEVEAVKSYITRQTERYRKPFARRVTENPRSCIFIGTTNREQFLPDKTGNRRFYPLRTNGSGYDLFDRKDEVKEDIKQCWAEAVHLFKAGKLAPHANRALLTVIRAEQSLASEDDWRIGVIEKYLNKKNVGDAVCVIELWEKALGEQFNKPERKDSNEISAIMQNQPDWRKEKHPKAIGEWGYQRVWVKCAETIPIEELPFFD